MELIDVLNQVKQEENAEYIKVYFQDIDNYTIKIIRGGLCAKRISKGSKTFDIKEDKAKGRVNKKAK